MVNRIVIIKIITLVVFLGLVTGYAYSNTIDMIKGPEIIISTPNDGVVVRDNLVTVSGQALRIAKIYLNDKQIFTNNEGYFEELIASPEGYNAFKLTANDIFGRQTEKIIVFNYQPTN